MTDKIARYGWIPDLPDQRDHLFAAPPPILSALPSQVDQRKGCPPAYDQGQLGSCTANAIGGAIEFDQMKEKLPDVYTPSRLFIYYNERALEGTVNSDGGAQIRDGIKTVASNGACHETLWPYNTAEYANRPPSQAYEDGAKHTTVSYQRVNRDLAQMKGCLAAGSPFVFGFTVYESFESQKVASTGHCPLPGPAEQTVGGHAVLAVGYDDANQWFLVRNSWGANWGMSGYFTLPYTYLTMRSLSSDFWTIRVVK
jgi:C1A family cysteine protease